ncbi:NADH-cytochrome b5 reductase 3-like [Haemaphysalis longicornis]
MAQRRNGLLLFAAAAAVVGAFAMAVYWYRKLRVLLGNDVLLGDPSAVYTVSLKRRTRINHNVRLLTFALPNSNQKLGFRTGQHVLLQARIDRRQVVRPYTPVTLSDRKGSFDIMVKVYRAEENDCKHGGLMSQYLDKMNPGDTIQIAGPYGSFVYKGRGRFATWTGHKVPHAKRLGLIAAGSGVTPILQLLRHIAADKGDQTLVKMIDVNVSEKDIIANEELYKYAKRFKTTFSIRHVLDMLPPFEGTGYIQGPLNQDIMAAHLPLPDQRTLVLCCGPPGLMSDVCAPALRSIGHKSSHILFY